MKTILTSLFLSLLIFSTKSVSLENMHHFFNATYDIDHDGYATIS